MSHITDDDIVAALRAAVPEPPESPARLAGVRRRVAHRRRAQLSAGSLAVVAIVAGGVAVNSSGGTGHHQVTPAAALVPVPDGIPAALGRPLHLPHVAVGTPCPISASHTYPAGEGFNSPYAAVGDGPFTLTGNGRVAVDLTPADPDQYAAKGWPGTKVIWRIAGNYAGPLLVRGGRLDAAGGMLFDDAVRDVPVGGAAGQTVYPELAYPQLDTAPGPLTYPGTLRVQTPGCYGIQVDGTSFSEVITFAVVPGSFG
jgi:hypothetical protein